MEITCYTSNPKITLKWTKYQGGLPYEAQDQNGQLIIYRIKSEDSGIYVCTGQDASTGATISAQAQISVENEFVPPPTARIEPNRLGK